MTTPKAKFAGLALIAVLVLLPCTSTAQQETEEPPATLKQSQGTPVEAPAPQGEAPKPSAQQEPPTAQPLSAVPVQSERRAEPPCDARCQAAEKREKDDLEAQQGMARYAKELADLTTWQIGVALIAIILLGVTLYYTRKATNAATDAAGAAGDVVKVSSDTAERQLRAYVSIEDAKRIRSKGRRMIDPWTIETKIKNFGQTPAYSLTVLIDNKIVDVAGSKDVELPEPRYKETTQFDLAPGHTFTIRQDIPELFGKIMQAFNARQKVIFHWGRIDFTDAFGKKRWITFRMYQGSGYVQNLMYDNKGNETSESPPADA